MEFRYLYILSEYPFFMVEQENKLYEWLIQKSGEKFDFKGYQNTLFWLFISLIIFFALYFSVEKLNTIKIQQIGIGSVFTILALFWMLGRVWTTIDKSETYLRLQERWIRLIAGLVVFLILLYIIFNIGHIIEFVYMLFTQKLAVVIP